MYLLNDNQYPTSDSSVIHSAIDWNDPPLFKPDKIRVKEYWEAISLVAPYADTSKVWRAKDAIKAYCTICKKQIP